MDEKKFRCTHEGCTKSFNRRDYLIRHAANHLDVPPFKCDQCPQRFARADLLEKHLTTKSHEKRRKREEKQERMKEKARIKQARKSTAVPDNSAPESDIVASYNDKSAGEFQEYPPVTAAAGSSVPISDQQPQRPPEGHNGATQGYYQYGRIPVGNYKPPAAPPQTAGASVHNQPYRYDSVRIPPIPLPGHSQSVSAMSAGSSYNNSPNSTTSMPPPSQAHYLNPSLNEDYLFSSFPETLPDEFGNVDYKNSSNMEYNVSGNYAWLFGREFWSDVNPKGASYAYELLTDASNSNSLDSSLPPPQHGGRPLQQQPIGQSQQTFINQHHHQQHVQHQHQQNHHHHQQPPPPPPPQQQQQQSQQQPPPPPQLQQQQQQLEQQQQQQQQQQHRHDQRRAAQQAAHKDTTEDIRAATERQRTIERTEPMIASANGNNNLETKAVEIKADDLRPSASSQPRMPGPDYLGSRIDLNSSLLSKYTDQKQRRKVFKPENHPNEAEPLMNATRTVYTRDSNDKNSAVKDHVFGRTYSESPIKSVLSSQALKRDHVYVDSAAHARVINVIQVSQMMNMEQQSTNWAIHPKFTPEMLSWYLELFWSNFDPLYPIVHKPKFIAREARAEQLISMALIGIAYSNDSATYDLAVAIYPKIRIVILAMINDEPHVPIWVHQCLLLINYFASVFGSHRLIEMSQVFHGSHIALLRLSGYLKMGPPEIPEDYSVLDVEEFWDRYIAFETKKRTAFFAFICDTEQAVFYRHNLGLSVFEYNLELPCTDACWEAPTGDTFIEIYRVQPRHLQPRTPPDLEELSSYPNEYPNNATVAQERELAEKRAKERERLARAQAAKSQGMDVDEDSKEENSAEEEEMLKEPPVPTAGNWPPFLFSVRRLMTPYREEQTEYPLECFSPYSRVILLHGLLNVSWEMQWRGIFDMGIVSKKRMNEFKIRLVVGLTSWKGSFDRQLRKLDTPELNCIVTNYTSSNASSPMFEEEHQSTISAFPYRLTPNSIDLNNYSNTLMLSSNWALYHFGLIVLYEDTLMIQRFAGLPRLISDDSQLHGSQIRARQYVNDWLQSLDSKWATWHCMHYLQRLFYNDLLIHQADALPWITFVAALSLWAYDRDTCKEKAIVSSQQYMLSQLPPPDTEYHPDSPPLEINRELARRDALLYLEMIRNSPPKSLTGTSPKRHDDAPTPSDPLKRAEYVIAVVAFTYSLLQRFDRSGSHYLQVLYRILVQWP